MNADGNVIASARSFAEDLVIADFGNGSGDNRADFEEECEAVYQALVLGTRDYIRKCGFARVLIGLSGGIDSALTAALAVEAVGKGKCHGRGHARPLLIDHSVRDAKEMAEKTWGPI